MDRKELEETILQYMATHHTVSLATVKDDIPHAATVFFINIKFNLYFFSSPTSRHGVNFSNNPQVSATINEDYSEWLSIKGIQMEGIVENIGGILKNPRISREYVKKFPGVSDFIFSPLKLGEAVARKVAGVDFYKLVPSRMYFLNNELGFGHRDELIL